jgi:hypothetical protein
VLGQTILYNKGWQNPGGGLEKEEGINYLLSQITFF